MYCNFVKELNKLRKSSIESIDDVDSFNKIKEYMHIDRLIEFELESLLKQVSCSGKKTLVLLCGSAGDGKSHLLSYFNNINDDNLLDEFTVYNDAAESDRKNRTAIQRVADVLKDFKDDCLDSPGTNVIIAINLGILSNFIESDESKYFSRLKDFVKKKNILTGQIRNNVFENDNHFQCISFGDYNLFSLSESGIKTNYLIQLINKICFTSDDNPFYKMYCSGSSCPLCSKCPVRHNFEFLSDSTVQKNISKIICEVIVKDKNMMSTREILDFVYDILVHHSFDYDILCEKEPTESEYLDTYIQFSMPMLIYEYIDRSPLINGIIKYDVLKERSEALDESAIQFSVSNDATKTLEEAIINTPYSKVLQTDALKLNINRKKDMKSRLFKMMIRLHSLKDNHSFNTDPIYLSYIQNLYWYNKGNRAKLFDLYELVTQCIFEWNGRFDNNHICLNNIHDTFAIFEELNIEPHLEYLPDTTQDNLEKFSPCISVSFKKKDMNSGFISLDIDYSLYRLFVDMKNGYHPSAEDRNNHADFVAFIRSLIPLGNASKEIIIIDNRLENKKKGLFRKTAFGYEFKVL